MKAFYHARTTAVTCLLMAAALSWLVSCSGNVSSSDEAVERMIEAYGGTESVKALMNFSAKGFIKDLKSKSIAKSYPFDVYQKGRSIKHHIMMVEKGNYVGTRIIIFNGQDGYQWNPSTGRMDLENWFTGTLPFKFPRVLDWVSDPGLRGELMEEGREEGKQKIRFLDSGATVILTLDTDSWLLEGVKVTLQSDTVLVFEELYDNYREVDGVPFPGRFTGIILGDKVYEYFLPTIEYGIELPDSIFTVMVRDTSGIVD